MKLEITQEQGVFILRPEGPNLDATLSGRLRQEITSVLDEDGCLVLDLSQVQFADSSGLSVLCDMQRRAGENRIAVVGVGGRLASIFSRIPGGQLPHGAAQIEDAIGILTADRRAERTAKKPTLRIAHECSEPLTGSVRQSQTG